MSWKGVTWLIAENRAPCFVWWDVSLPAQQWAGKPISLTSVGSRKGGKNEKKSAWAQAAQSVWAELRNGVKAESN